MRCIISAITKRRRDEGPKVAASLGHDLGVPDKVARRVLEQTAADLRQLAETDEAADARPIINKAFDELARYRHHFGRSDEALIERCLGELPERDLTILRHFKHGKKQREIAELMGTDVDSVRRSLVNTYADLRMKLRAFDGGETDRTTESH